MGPLPASNHHHVLPYRDEHLSLDFDQQAASLDTERMTLTRKEYDLLALLVQHAGEIIPREALLMQVWGGLGRIGGCCPISGMVGGQTSGVRCEGGGCGLWPSS